MRSRESRQSLSLRDPVPTATGSFLALAFPAVRRRCAAKAPRRQVHGANRATAKIASPAAPGLVPGLPFSPCVFIEWWQELFLAQYLQEPWLAREKFRMAVRQGEPE